MKNTNFQIAWSLVGILAGSAAILGCAASATAQNEERQMRIVEVERLGDEGDEQEVVVRIEDDDVSVIIDGEEIDDDQILREKGKLVILGDDGEVLHEIKMPHQKRHHYRRLGGKRGHAEDEDFQFNFSVGEEPKIMLGIQMTNPGKALEKHLGLDHKATTMVQGIYKGLPADEAGMNEFDIITAVDGNSPADSATIMKALKDKEPGDTVMFRVVQKGKTKDVTVTLAAFDREAWEDAEYVGTEDANRFSFQRNNDGPRWREFIPMPEMEGHVFAPDVMDAERLRRHIERAAPRIHEHLGAHREALELRLESLEDQLEQLHAMIAELHADRE